MNSRPANLRGTPSRVFAASAAVLMVIAGLSTATPATASELVFSEDFESTELGAYPDSLLPLTSTNGYTAEVDVADGEGDRALRIVKTAAAMESTYATRDLTSGIGLHGATISIRAMAEQTDLVAFIAGVRGQTDVITQLAFYDNAALRIFTPAGWSTIGEYEPFTWYDFDLHFDAEAGVIRVDRNGEILAEDVPFRASQDALRQWRTGLFSGPATGAIWIDDIEIHGGTESEDDAAFAEDFESFEPGEYPDTFDPQNPAPPHVAEVVDEDGGRALSIRRESASSSSHYVHKTLSEPLEVARLTFRAQVSTSETEALVPIVRGPGGPIAQVAFHRNGWIGVHQGTWTSVVPDYETGRWYDFEVTVNAVDQTWSLAVDGQLRRAGLSFQTEQPTLNQISFGIFQGEVTALTIDDVVVRAVDPSATVPVSGVSVTPAQHTMAEGSAFSLVASVLPTTATNRTVAWSTDSPQVAAVDQSGRVTAIAEGQARITAVTVDGGFQAHGEIVVVPRSLQYEFYVDPVHGDDAATGTFEEPFRTVAAARNALREATAQGTAMTGDAEIVLRGGEYVLTEPLDLDERDTSDSGFSVTYRAYEGEVPILTGGTPITGWQVHDEARGIYRAPAAGTQTRQLYVDGRRAIRARSGGPLTDAILTDLGVRSTDVEIEEWSAPEDLEFVFQERWTQPRVQVSHVEPAADGQSIEFVMSEPGWTAARTKGLTSILSGPIRIENAYELLDDDGEWFSDGEYFYYKPRAFEDMSTATIVAPVLEQLLRVEGSSLDDRVANLVFDGLTFSYTTWLFPSTDAGLSDAQNNHLRYSGQDDLLVDAAVVVRKAHDVTFRNNTFARIGSTGLQLIDGVQHSVVDGNRFFDISGSALNVGEPTTNDPEIHSPSDPRLVILGNDVTNNYIHDIGVEYASAAAVSAGFPVDFDLSHNQIFNIPYSGIHIGYGWYTFVSAGQRDMRIENNYIHDLLDAGLYDGGAIYTVGYTGASPEEPNIVSGNYLQNQQDLWGLIYADNASDYWLFRENVIDQRETPMWGVWPAYWAYGKQAELRFESNYTTSPHVNTSFGAPLDIVDTHVYPEGDWPDRGWEIVDNAGVGTGYQDITLGVDRVQATTELVLSTTESAVVEVSATRQKGQGAIVGSYEVFFRSLNAEVAEVSQSGVVTALGHGLARIETSILVGDVVWTRQTHVYVDDSLEEIRFRHVLDEGRSMTAGEVLDIGVYGVSLLGREFDLPDAQLVSSDPGVVTVQEDGTLIGVTEGAAVVTVTASGISKHLPVEVVLRTSELGLSVPEYLLAEEFDDQAGWSVSSGSLAFEDGGVRFATPGGQGSYTSTAFADELLTFDATIDAAAGWEVIQIRNQNLAAPVTDTYAIVIKPNEIELQRFIDGERTVIFGNVTGFTSVGGDATPNEVFPFGERRRVSVGAINEPDGVRIVFNVEDENVFYYLDTAADRIVDPGYLSIYARYGSVLLHPAQPRSIGEPPAQGVLSTTSGWSHGLHDGNFDVRMNMWWGVPGTEFRLYQDGEQIAAMAVESEGEHGPQDAVVPVTGLPNGTYEYTGELRNSGGSTMTTSATVVVDAANPGSPVLHARPQGASGVTLVTDMWWGTNATEYQLLRNGVVIDEQPLTANSPHAQTVSTPLHNLLPGHYVFQTRLANAVGESVSNEVAVTVLPEGLE